MPISPVAMISPVAPSSPVASAMHSLGLSKSDICRMTGLSNSTVEYTIRCMYPRMNYQVASLLEPANPNITEDYNLFQFNKRQNSIITPIIRERRKEADLPISQSNPNSPSLLWEPFIPNFPSMPEIHPHMEFRQITLEMTVEDYCSDLCIERYVVQHFEESVHPQFARPIRQALTVAAGPQIINQLVEAHKVYAQASMETRGLVMRGSVLLKKAELLTERVDNG